MPVTMRFRIEKKSGQRWQYLCEVDGRGAATRMLHELSKDGTAARVTDTVTGTVMEVPAHYYDENVR